MCIDYFTYCVFHCSLSRWSFTRVYDSKSPQDSSQYSRQFQQCWMVSIYPWFWLLPNHYFTPWRVFHTSISWWFLTGVWVSPQVSRTLLSILIDLNNAVVRMVSTCLLISNSSSLFTNPLGIFPSAPITISITATFTFYRFLFSSKVLVLFSLFHFLSFSLCGLLWQQSSLFFFFHDYH